MIASLRMLIAGCGYVGIALGKAAAQKGFSVWGLRRNEEKADELNAAHILPLISDLTQPETLKKIPEVDFVVSCQAPGREGADYRSTYLEGTKNLIAAVEKFPIQKFLWLSSTGVYSHSGGEWVDEATDPKPASESSKILTQTESLVKSAPFSSLVLRLGGIYGPGRDRLKLLKDGVVSQDDPGYLNHIHRADIVQLILFLLERGTDKEIYLGVDDEPVIRSEFYKWLIKAAQIKVPKQTKSGEARSRGSKRCSNKKIKDLGFTFQYPTYREGFASLIPGAKKPTMKTYGELEAEKQQKNLRK